MENNMDNGTETWLHGGYVGVVWGASFQLPLRVNPFFAH